MNRCITRGVSALALFAAVTALVAPQAARAEEDEAPNYAGDLWTRDALTGDWGGARTKLYERGVKFEAEYTGDASTNLSGGFRRGEGYSGFLSLGLTLDLEKLAGWTGGEVYAGAYIIRGHGLTTYDIGNLLAVSGVEADHANRLGEVYFKQTLFDGRFSIRIGQLLADSEFITSDTAGLFVNSAFGWPGINGAVLPSGGPAYPVPTPGVHVTYQFNDAFSAQAAIYNGDPAGHNVNPHNLDFPLHEGVFGIGELAYKTDGLFGKPGVIKVGAWFNTANKFDDLRFAGVTHGNDYAVYGMIDQTIWEGGGSADLKDPSPDTSSVSVFARTVWTPQENRNLIDYYLDAGLNLKGFVPGRAEDIFGVAVAYAKISGDARKADRLAGAPVRSSEIALEATYKAQVTPWLALQPFAQYLIRPGGGDPRPSNPDRRIKNATVLGFRTQVSF
ncbi:carbohydrate porin [Methylopila sp. M107]|uniref:carbohydrate porin n=1 Tax=Methylopila sp. M107 TaxID=1101190 RepID=UPI00035D1D35|nr:carbohydrate porin [Methylopila sp. M107]